jgi:nucleoid-associated protein YgaU
MRAIPSTAAAVMMIFATLQLLRAQQPPPVRTGTPGAQPETLTTNQTGAISGEVRTGGKDPASRTVQLRDAQSGRVVATNTSDKAGAFTFSGVQPGTYIVEVLGANQSVLAASSVLTVQAGQTLSVVLGLPIAAGGILGGTAGTAAMIAAGAAAAGVLAVQKTGDPTCPQ